MTKSDVNNYIICLYYLCKTEFHDKYMRVCDVLNKKDGKVYVAKRCNCLTSSGCDSIRHFIENAKNSTNNEITSDKCDPVEKHSDVFFDYFQSIFLEGEIDKNYSEFELNYEDFSDLGVIIDLYICCAALSNCSFAITNMKDFVGLVCSTADLIENSIEPRTAIDNSKRQDKEYMLCIIDSFELLKQLEKDAKIHRQSYSIFDVAKKQKENIDRILNENSEKLQNSESDRLGLSNQKLLNRAIANSLSTDKEQSSFVVKKSNN